MSGRKLLDPTTYTYIGYYKQAELYEAHSDLHNAMKTFFSMLANTASSILAQTRRLVANNGAANTLCPKYEAKMKDSKFRLHKEIQ